MQLTNSLSPRILHTCALAACLSACGSSSATTPQLVDARRAYDHAEDSPARTRAPGELADARAALERAETAHDQNPGSEQEANLARRATRKSLNAEMHGEEIAANRTELAAKSEPPRGEVVVERVPAPAPAHRRSPSSAEKHADAALQSLAQVGNVKQEPRGVVITLSGSLLFPSGDRDVSPIADKSLDQVAHALAQQPNDRNFSIEGFTDSSGSERENQMLSERRAQAVADRLTEAGIDASRIRVVGRGEAEPIADNATAEGRASNRRVEIVVMRPE
jgi:outer membrane protein OmpA-like peptidoglycan-associated protein